MRKIYQMPITEIVSIKLKENLLANVSSGQTREDPWAEGKDYRPVGDDNDTGDWGNMWN